MSRPFADLFLQSDGRGLQQQPNEILIRMQEYLHDVARVTLKYEKATADKYTYGRPVTLRWGWLPDQVEYFHGYVHHTETVEDAHKHRWLNVYFIGATYRMRETKQRSFRNMPAHRIAAQIAKEHKLSLLVERDAFLHQHLSQHGRSDWAFLVWLAKRIGYTFYGKKTDLHLVKRVVDKSPSPQLATFKFVSGRNVHRRAVYHFTHKVGDDLPNTGKRIRIKHGVTAGGQKLTHKTGAANCKKAGTHASKAVFTKHETHASSRPAHTPAELKHINEARAEWNRFIYHAGAEVSGDTRVHQGSTVRLTDIDSENDGYWYVFGVDHIITLRDYRCELRLGRDSMGDASINTPSPVVSPSGNQTLLSACDTDLSTAVGQGPQPVYDPVDDCAPLADLPEDDPFGNAPTAGPAPLPTSPATKKKKVAARKRRSCTCCASPKVAAKKHAAPKLNGWRASSSSIRIKGVRHRASF